MRGAVKSREAVRRGGNMPGRLDSAPHRCDQLQIRSNDMNQAGTCPFCEESYPVHDGVMDRHTYDGGFVQMTCPGWMRHPIPGSIVDADTPEHRVDQLDEETIRETMVRVIKIVEAGEPIDSIRAALSKWSLTTRS